MVVVLEDAMLGLRLVDGSRSSGTLDKVLVLAFFLMPPRSE